MQRLKAYDIVDLSLHSGEEREVTFQYDVTLVLTLHREGKLLLRTLLSIREAALFARAAGLSIELVAVLDLPDEVTVEVLSNFDLTAFDGHDFLRVENGSLGLSRNSGINVARGKYICTCDGDDLISYNFVAAMHSDAERKGPLRAFFPQYLVGFEASNLVTEYMCLDEIAPFALLHMHPFISRIFAHRDLFAAQQYADVRLSRGYAYEDWHFNSEITARGYTLDVTQDTILFYRQRPDGLLRKADSTSVRQIPPSKLFRPSTFLERGQSAHEKLMCVDEIRANLRTRGTNPVQDPVCLALIAAANEIEPAIDTRLIASCETYTNAAVLNINIGKAYYKICNRIGDMIFDDVFVFPFFGGGGAELYALHIMRELIVQNPTINILVLFGEKIDHHVWLDRIPDSVVVVDLASAEFAFDEETRDMIALKLVQSSASRARIHIRHSSFSERFFGKFRTILQDNECIYHRFGNMAHSEGDYRITVAGGFNFVSENLDYIHSIIADNETIITNDQMRLGVQIGKWQCLRVPHQPKVDIKAAVTKTLRAPARVLWASRIASEKRPWLIPNIARRFVEMKSNISISVFGTDAFGQFDPAIICNSPNVTYGGPFSDFSKIAANEYACFIYTSMFDGMPNVVLEAISMGIPVIAPDVGGISEIIIDNETGVLLPSLNDDDDMAAQYVEAIARLVERPRLRADIVDNALTRLLQNHSSAIFAKRVAQIFNLKKAPPNRGRALLES